MRTTPVEFDRGTLRVSLRQFRTTPPFSWVQALFMRRYVVRAQVRDALQFHRRLAAVESDIRIAVTRPHIAVALQP